MNKDVNDWFCVLHVHRAIITAKGRRSYTYVT